MSLASAGLHALRRRVPYRIRDLVRPHYPPAARPWLKGSFSQVGEDRIIRYLFDVIGVQRPSYLDIGAHHPFLFSNTAMLHLVGSRGVNVEPDPDLIALFRRHRPADVNLGVGCAAERGRLTLYRMSERTLNTLSKDVAEQVERESEGRFRIVEQVEVEVRTAAEILREHFSAGLDLLSLDVEGLDVPILRTMSEWPTLPTVICVETVPFVDSGIADTLTGAAEVVADHGYVPFASTHVNTLFVRRDRWAVRLSPA